MADDSKEEGYVFVENMLFAVATVGPTVGLDVFEMTVMDAKDAFRHVSLDEQLA